MAGSELPGSPVHGSQDGYKGVAGISERLSLPCCERQHCHHQSKGPEAPRCQRRPGPREAGAHSGPGRRLGHRLGWVLKGSELPHWGVIEKAWAASLKKAGTCMVDARVQGVENAQDASRKAWRSATVQGEAPPTLLFIFKLLALLLHLTCTGAGLEELLGNSSRQHSNPSERPYSYSHASFSDSQWRGRKSLRGSATLQNICAHVPRGQPL